MVSDVRCGVVGVLLAAHCCAVHCCWFQKQPTYQKQQRRHPMSLGAGGMCSRCTAQRCCPVAARLRSAQTPQKGCLQHHAHATLLTNDAGRRCCWLAQPWLVMLQLLASQL